VLEDGALVQWPERQEPDVLHAADSTDRSGRPNHGR
jgi:hypothetical protein